MVPLPDTNKPSVRVIVNEYRFHSVVNAKVPPVKYLVLEVEELVLSANVIP